MTDLGDVVGGLFLADVVQFGAYVILDVTVAGVRREQAAIVAAEERRRERDEALVDLGSLGTFSSGATALPDPDGTPHLRPVVVVITGGDLALLDARVDEDPTTVLARIPRSEVEGVRLLDEHGEVLEVGEVDEVAELDAPRDRSYLVALDRQTSGRRGSHVFVFRSVSVAAEAVRNFERALSA